MSYISVVALCILLIALVQGPSALWGVMAFALGMVTHWYVKE